MDTYDRSTIGQLRSFVRRIGEVAPGLATRAEAAASIILAGKVAEHAEGFEVLGSGEQAYTVSGSPLACTCPDFARRGVEFAGRKFCKHVLSVLILCRLTTRRPSARAERVATFRQRARRPVRRAA